MILGKQQPSSRRGRVLAGVVGNARDVVVAQGHLRGEFGGAATEVAVVAAGGTLLAPQGDHPPHYRHVVGAQAGRQPAAWASAKAMNWNAGVTSAGSETQLPTNSRTLGFLLAEKPGATSQGSFRRVGKVCRRGQLLELLTGSGGGHLR